MSAAEPLQVYDRESGILRKGAGGAGSVDGQTIQVFARVAPLAEAEAVKQCSGHAAGVFVHVGGVGSYTVALRLLAWFWGASCLVPPGCRCSLLAAHCRLSEAHVQVGMCRPHQGGAVDPAGSAWLVAYIQVRARAGQAQWSH